MSSHLLIIHIAQVRELEPVLCRAGQTSQLIWTSSNNAHRSAFSLEDLQHQKGTQPYSSSKYASDLLSLALNIHHNNQVCTILQKVIFQLYGVSMTTCCYVFLQGLYSSVICPGFVMTNLTYSILPTLPAFLWTLLLPIFWLVSPTSCCTWGKLRNNSFFIQIHVSSMLTDKSVHQHIHIDTLQWSWSTGKLNISLNYHILVSTD